jgi:hypothetical protein
VRRSVEKSIRKPHVGKFQTLGLTVYLNGKSVEEEKTVL